MPFSGARRATVTTATSSGARPRPSRELVAARREPVGGVAEALDVDRVREDADPFRGRAERHDRVARERAGDEDARRAGDDRRHDDLLHPPPPAGLRAGVVALDEQNVGHVP